MPAAPPPKGTQAIVVLVNDEPITAWEIEQRAGFVAANSGGNPKDMKAKAEARWAQIVKDPKTNERFQDFMRANNVQSQEQAKALQAEFVKKLQADMIDQIRREVARRHGVPVSQAGAGGADRGAPQAAGSQEARRGDFRRRRQAHAAGHRRPQQDDHRPVRPAGEVDRLRHLHAARAAAQRAGLARGRPPPLRRPDQHQPEGRRPHAVGGGHRGRRGRLRAAGAEGHAAHTGPGRSGHAGAALLGGAGPARQGRRLQEHGKPRQGGDRRQVRGFQIRASRATCPSRRAR